jgi:purine-binding chemotaxis protein CheW
LDVEKDLIDEIENNKYLMFSVDSESYGIQIRYIIEIIKIIEITKVPEQPKFVKGVINLRGSIIPVIDARLRFDKEERDYDDRTCILVIEIKEVTFGLIVDNVHEVVNIQECDIASPPVINSSYNNCPDGFIEGIGKVSEHTWLLIDCEKLLKSESESDKHM